jgi:hypothetical protein
MLEATNIPQNTQVPYTITGISQDDIDLPLTGSTLSISYNGFIISSDLSTEGAETMVVTLDGITPTVSAALVINDSTTPVPTYNAYFLANNAPVGDVPITEWNEESGNPHIAFIVETTNVVDPISYTITGISQEDVDVPLTGILGNDYGLFNSYSYLTFNLVTDNLTEGPETMVITLDGITPTVSAALVINDTSTTPVPTYDLYFGSSESIITSAGEGSANQYGTYIFLETTNVPNPIPYTITGISPEDIDIPLTGTLDPGAVAFPSTLGFNIIEDNLTEGPETMVITLDGITPTVSAALVINDTSTTPVPTYDLYFVDQYGTPYITETNEGGGHVELRLDTTNVSEPTPYTITGVSQEDISIPLTGTMQGAGAGITIFISEDLLTEGPETMVVTLDGITPTVSAALVINDTSVFVSPLDTTIYNSDGTLYNTAGNPLNGNVPDNWKLNQNIAGYVDIGTSVTTIGDNAFRNNQLTSVTIPNSVTSIGTRAFYINQLTSVTIPNSVTSIGSVAFETNPSLATVNSYTTRTSFGSNAFRTTASPLTIHARASDTTWTAGSGQSLLGNNNVTVIKDL